MAVTKEQVGNVREAYWEGWKKLAKELKHHKVLSVEMLRTRHDETVAVFTVLRNYEPVQYVVRGDARGGTNTVSRNAPAALETHTEAARGDPAEPDNMALGEPPPKQPPPPGIVALGTVLLSTAFNLGEKLS